MVKRARTKRRRGGSKAATATTVLLVAGGAAVAAGAIWYAKKSHGYIKPPPPGTFRVSVLDNSTFAPIADATVTYVMTTKTTDSSGLTQPFTIVSGNLPQITISATGYTTQTFGYNATSGGTLTVRLNSKSPPGTISFTVIVRDIGTGLVLGAAVVSFGTSPNPIVSGTTSAGGSVTLTVVPVGSQQIIISHTGYRTLSTTLTPSNGATYPYDLSVTIG